MNDIDPQDAVPAVNPMAQNEPVEERFSTTTPIRLSSVNASTRPNKATSKVAADTNESLTHGDACSHSTESRSSTKIPLEDIEEALKDVIDPELGINIVDLGLVYGLDVDSDDTVRIDMTLTSPACPLTDIIERQSEMALQPFTDKVAINWVWMPPWGPNNITDDGRDQLRSLGFNL